MHLHSGRVFVQTASIPLVLLPSPISETQLGHGKGAARVKLSTPQSIADNNNKNKKLENEPGGGRTDATTNRPSKGCQITHTT